PPVFTATLAERLGKLTGILCAEAKDGEVLKNQIYIAPGDYHLRLGGNKVKTVIELSQDEPINFVRPAVDPLFESASSIYKEGCLGIVLTGMGQDGRNGSAFIKKNDGAVVIQNEESCVVFGMPGAVKNDGSFDLIKTPSEIAQVLKSKAVAIYG
ncbi:MAG TPA: CheB methylesterase domain-containing protein, partial [Bacteriovoracaceae bacterium]|nr:CheB methylesterase domain-containing protein [Bacteriovoracaceae bacterium]